MDNLLHTQAWIEERTGDTPYGCLIQQHGKTIAAWYGGGFSADSLFEIGSIRKSFNSALVGIGMQKGNVDVQAKVVEFWPEILTISGDKNDAAITLHHLASATSGWLTPQPPGQTFLYNNAAFTAAERVVARMYGLSSDEIASEVVTRFKIPLHMESSHVYHFERPFTPDDLENPGPKLAIDSTLSDLVAWGALWLNKGMWSGQEIIPADYVELATHQVNPHISGAYYGYNWFVNAQKALWPEAPEDSYGHAGFGTFKLSEKESRTYLWICPSLDIVAAIVVDITAGFANDFLEIPLGLTAEWIGRIVKAVS